MHVAHVAPTAFGVDGLFGGGERYPWELAGAISRHVPCRLVTYGSASRRERGADGLELVVLRAWRRVGGHPAHPVGPGLGDALDGVDVVHAHQLHSRTTRLALRAATKRGQGRAVTDHGLIGPDDPRRWEQIDRFLAVSRYSAEAVNAPRERTEVVFGGADPARFAPNPSERRRGILFVGRLTPHKGLDRLIRALPPGAELTLAGTGGHDPTPPASGYVEKLHRLAAAADARVVFTGRVSEDELPVLMRRAAVLVLPSVATTCYGTPVIASRIGGVSEIIPDGATGLLVEPGDLAALRDGLEDLLADHRLRHDLGRRARELASERFTWDACALRCLEVYEALLA